MKTTHFIRNLGALGALAATLVLVTGCSSHDDDVRAELKTLTQDAKPKIKPLEAPVAYKVFAYEVDKLSDPFSPAKISVRLKNSRGMQPDVERPKQALEAYPLETIRMVGAIKSEGVLTGAVSVDGFLYRVQPGQYIGQNFGRVTSVTETAIALKEMIQEANGDWRERDTVISIQDATEVKKK